MKNITKRAACLVAAGALTFVAVSFSCAKSAKGSKGKTSSAQSASSITRPTGSAENARALTDSLKMVEAIQDSFRAISEATLPAVVEVDVVETKTRKANPFEDMDSPFFFFFGRPGQGSDGGKEKQYEQKGLGSGVIVRRTGDVIYVLTNNHVAGDATKISVKLNDGREFDGTLVGNDTRMDIALVSFKSDDKEIPVVKLGDSDEAKTGDLCFAMGAPLGYNQSVTQGIISATGRSGAGIGNISDFIQTDAAINQGNSGGPLVNIYGEVIGINTWIASQSGGSQGIGFAIPINNIKHAIDDFITKGKITYGWLGVSLIDIPKEYKEALGVGGKTGAFASQLFLDSPAIKGGMQPGDFIVSLNGHTVKGVNTLVRDVGGLVAGSVNKFTVIRGGQEVEITVKIEERNEKTSSDSGKLWPGFIAVPINDDTRKEIKLEDDKVKGVIVTGVQEKSPAASLRLQNGDVITAVNGKATRDMKEFYAELSKANKSVNFDVYSNGGTITTGTYKF